MTARSNRKIHLPSFWVMICMILITFAATCYPGFEFHSTPLMKKDSLIDFFLHVMYYFIIAVVFFPLLNPRNNSSWIFFPALLVLSVIFEILQMWVPSRSFSFIDMVGNAIGILFAASFSYWGRRKYNRANRND